LRQGCSNTFKQVSGSYLTNWEFPNTYFKANHFFGRAAAKIDDKTGEQDDDDERNWKFS
jgi:hypothetical protein